jgi:hypothetical protein
MAKGDFIRDPLVLADGQGASAREVEARSAAVDAYPEGATREAAE